MVFENNKRVSFIHMANLPRMVARPLELALFLGDGDPLDPPVIKSDWHGAVEAPADVTDYQSDAIDRRYLEARGWRIRHSREVAATPWAFQRYVQESRGEFSCAKPSCMRFQNAWISDRTLCYLASGKPAVVQHTGPSAFLPNGEGFFRFTTLDQAAAALRTIDEDYARHCRAARELAAAHFDGQQVLADMLNIAFDSGRDAIERRAAVAEIP
jgi:glycosyltransferase involved in cell wall biosynthesis